MFRNGSAIMRLLKRPRQHAAKLTLISRIARGASYYWRTQDEVYFREYFEALTSKKFFLHLKSGWRTLPEPTPEPNKYERRVFALGPAYEFIAVRGSAYHLDLSRQYSLAGATRHTTADWRTIPLLSAVPQSDSAPQPANSQKTDLIGDGSRKETMSRFVTDGQWRRPFVRSRRNCLTGGDARTAGGDCAVLPGSVGTGDWGVGRR